MNADDVLQVYNDLLDNDIQIWVDGGWCVDALLGEQTRDHPDLDVAVSRKDNAKFRQLLESWGYTELKRADSSEWYYVMTTPTGKMIDVHSFEFDENQNNIWGIEYPFDSLTGTGEINGHTVSCISPKWMFTFKTSYAPKEKDIQDAHALAKKYGLTLPEPYK